VVLFLFCKYKILDAYESPKYANRWAELFSNIYRNAARWYLDMLHFLKYWKICRTSLNICTYERLLKIIPDLQDFLKYSRKCGISGKTLRYARFSEIHTDMQGFLEYLQILRTFWNTYRYARLAENLLSRAVTVSYLKQPLITNLFVHRVYVRCM
jgi:hypothetical protein